MKIKLQILISVVIFVILFFGLKCNPKIGYKTLYESDVVIYQKDSVDTVKVIYFDYIYINSLNQLEKKDGTIVRSNVRNFKILNKKQIKL